MGDGVGRNGGEEGKRDVGCTLKNRSALWIRTGKGGLEGRIWVPKLDVRKAMSTGIDSNAFIFVFCQDVGN